MDAVTSMRCMLKGAAHKQTITMEKKNGAWCCLHEGYLVLKRKNKRKNSTWIVRSSEHLIKFSVCSHQVMFFSKKLQWHVLGTSDTY